MWKTEELSTKNHLYLAAKELLANSDHEPMENLVSDISTTPGTQEDRAFVNGDKLYRLCAVHFPCSLSMKLWRVFTLVNAENIRDTAITQLRDLLRCDHVGGRRGPLHHLFVQELAPKLLAFLEEQAISEELFERVAEVISHVARQILTRNHPWWDELRDFISSRASIELRRSLYLMMNVPLPLEGEMLVTPLLKNLFPSILNSMDVFSGPRKGDEWVVAFVGAFCLVILMMGTMTTTRVDLTENLVYQMLKSLTKLVGSDMEAELVKKALAEVDAIMTRDSERYSDDHVEFVFDLMLKINGLHGVGKETKGQVLKIRMGLEKKKNIHHKIQSRIDRVTQWLSL